MREWTNNSLAVSVFRDEYTMSVLIEIMHTHYRIALVYNLYIYNKSLKLKNHNEYI
jgi:hypothetical protein